MAKRHSDKKIKHVSFNEYLSSHNVMPDGMLEPVNQTDMAILPVTINAPREGKKKNR